MSHRSRLIASFLAVLAMVAIPASVIDARAAEVIGVSGEIIDLEMNKGQLVRLDRPAATVFIADPEVADVQVKSPRLIYLSARKPGRTTLYAVDGAEKVLANMDVHVSHDLAGLRAAAQRMHPDAEIDLASVGGNLVVGGIVGSASAADDIRRLAESFVGKDDKVINRLAVDAPNQVGLRVRVAEVSRDVDKQLGFNWTALGSLSGFSLGLGMTNPFNVNVTQHTLSIGRAVGGWNLNTVLDALEQEGLVTVLAEPNLTAMSGETASFLAGGEFPIMVPQGDNRITIEFKKFGVSLAFTPTLAGGERISLHVRPEVSQLSTNGAITIPVAGGTLQVPALTTRRAETTVELGSGQSFAIAGLLQNNVTHDVSKFPGLGDVPVLGRLFRSDRFQRDESELVIIVTPYVVKPVSSRRLAAPTDGFHSPGDMERIVTGGVYKRGPAGPVGFKLD